MGLILEARGPFPFTFKSVLAPPKALEVAREAQSNEPDFSSFR